MTFVLRSLWPHYKKSCNNITSLSGRDQSVVTNVIAKWVILTYCNRSGIRQIRKRLTKTFRQPELFWWLIKLDKIYSSLIDLTKKKKKTSSRTLHLQNVKPHMFKKLFQSQDYTWLSSHAAAFHSEWLMAVSGLWGVGRLWFTGKELFSRSHF